MTVMELSGVLDSFATGTYTVTRRTVAGTGYDSSGVKTAPTTATFSISGLFHPAAGRDLQRLPEGMRTREVRVLLTPTLLRGAGGGFEPDLITADGDTWEVSMVERYAEIANYWRVIVLKAGG
jgi:hypothetical protein